jgi:Fic family protein
MKPFIPKELPLQNIDWEKLVSLIGNANRGLARYDGVLQGIVNPDLLLSPIMTQEAVLSSRIEGTQATLEEVLEFETSGIEGNSHNNDITEILNYRKAMKYALESLIKRPICLNLILEIHSMLLDSVRGYDKSKGIFRKVQNYIGRPGARIEEAQYIPPSPELVQDCMSNLEKYIHYDEKDKLVQLAIVHAQFEIIHPFIDRNGRLGRILIPLFLFEKGLIIQPVFYMSDYLEKNRSQYYERLRAITKESDWTGWIIFFLEAIENQAKLNIKKALKILSLYEEMKKRIPEITHSQYSINTLDAIFYTPIFTTSYFIQNSKTPKRSALLILDSLRKEGLLEVIREGRGRQPTTLSFSKLVEIVKA